MSVCNRVGCICVEFRNEVVATIDTVSIPGETLANTIIAYGYLDTAILLQRKIDQHRSNAVITCHDDCWCWDAYASVCVIEELTGLKVSDQKEKGE